MAMDLGGARGGKKRPAPDMNVTPLIDVVLVLLIIFMAMTPVAARKFYVHTPKQEKEEVEQPANDPQPPLVLSVAADGVITVNSVTLTREELPDRLPPHVRGAHRSRHLLRCRRRRPLRRGDADDGRGPRRRRRDDRDAHRAARRRGAGCGRRRGPAPENSFTRRNGAAERT
jgi:biopolymer transport protein ExbD